MKTKQYILTACTLLLLALWIPVSLDKLWDLPGFHRTLLRQPFPDAWADVLYWLLPILELACAVLLVGGAVAKPTTNRLRQKGFALSALLLLAFTVFILLGVLGWYDKRPCGCGSVISGLSWGQHLWFNVVFLLMSVLGWWLGRGAVPQDGDGGQDGSNGPTGPGGAGHPTAPEAPATDALRSTLLLLAFRRSCRLRYPRKFALFPGRPVGQQLIPSYTLDRMGAVSRMGAGEHTRAAARRQRWLQRTR